MKKIVLLLVVFISITFADSALLLKKGWQLIGSTTKIDNMDIFASKDVEQVWRYEARTQKWQGYSPDSAIQKKITDKGYSKILSIENWHGFWIKSKNDWVLTFPADVIQRDENITLKKGWNLISLPVNTVVSPHIFDDKTVWKYAKKDGWELFEKETKEDFPAISHITNSDGIWVKSDKEQSISVSTNSSKLHNFDNESDMKAYIKDMLLINDRPICGYYPMVRGGVDGGMVMADKGAMEDGVEKGVVETPQVNDATGTNLQEEGVDESDIIKHDNTNIFYVSSDRDKYDKTYVNVTTFENILNNRLKPIKKILIDGFVDSLYLVDDRLVVLSRYGYHNYKPVEPITGEKIAIDHGGDVSSMIVEIFNVSNISKIEKIATYKINGQLNNSRVLNGKLFLITNFNPYVRKTYPKIYINAPECKEFFKPYYYPESAEDDDYEGSSQSGETVVPPQMKASRDKYDDYKKYAKCYNLYIDEDGRYYRYDYDNPQITYEKLIPYVQRDTDTQKPLITPKSFFVPSKKDQDPTITTVSEIDIQSADLENTSSILGYSNTVYASKNALYLVSNKYPIFYNFDRYQERSIIYKFSLDENLAYTASGFVNGYVLNQFSLSEYKDILRIATTEGNSWQNNTVNSLYTLSQHENSLLINGVLSGLGKDGETIRSVRFIGDHGYLVTFRQTDPFYTIDLSDANNPKKAGELNIDGYSSYLHPIDETHILGIGRDATPDGQVAGLKMELFNIEDFSNPQSVSTHSFGNLYSYSELENNHKALAYRYSDKLLGFTYSMDKGLNKLGVFQIDGDSINTYKPIKSPNTNQYYNRFERGLIFDDANGKSFVAYFANGDISYAALDDLK